ncbi:hypothetical protein [Mycolicibacterium fallax]|uniref:Uncharacterized protein n=1 Tax=Mycolicibacterium fallax TaxID=1793 RepID=A0A1X1R7Q6_MYCFA|nr:hypothetical protein [Mycolicibacterium fallax]ORV00954.1 hypothetical protein AWC04_14875 [Mycolicibacterium fallax]BBZ00507.1 hypothetical protein MFAL_39730 [Mycolicibacterium fallax]
MITTDPARYPCVFTGQTADGRTVCWDRGNWSGDWDLIRAADSLRGVDLSMQAIAVAIAAVVGEDGMVSETITALLNKEDKP